MGHRGQALWQSKVKGVWVAVHTREAWGGHCNSCCLSSFRPEEPLRDSWEPSKSRQCGLTSWNSAEPLSLGDPRHCPNKQKAAGKRPGQEVREAGSAMGRRRKSEVPGSLGLWAVGSVASSWLLEFRLCATNSPDAGRLGRTAEDSGWATGIRGLYQGEHRLSCLFFKVSWHFSIL